MTNIYGVCSIWNCVYKRNGKYWTIYACRSSQRCYYINTLESCPIAQAIPISIQREATSYTINVTGPNFTILPMIDMISDFEDNNGWEDLADGFNTAVVDKIIILDQYLLPSDNYLELVNGIIRGTTSIVSNGSFEFESPIGPAGTSAVVLAPSTKWDDRFYAKGYNWVYGLKRSISVLTWVSRCNYCFHHLGYSCLTSQHYWRCCHYCIRQKICNDWMQRRLAS